MSKQHAIETITETPFVKATLPSPSIKRSSSIWRINTSLHTTQVSNLAIVAMWVTAPLPEKLRPLFFSGRPEKIKEFPAVPTQNLSNLRHKSQYWKVFW